MSHKYILCVEHTIPRWWIQSLRGNWIMTTLIWSIDVLTDPVIAWWYYLEITETRRWGLGGRTQSLGTNLWQVCLVHVPFLYVSLCFPTNMWLHSLIAMESWLSTDPAVVPCDCETKPSKQWASLHCSSLWVFSPHWDILSQLLKIVTINKTNGVF